ncbi:hypothetical protein AMIS_2580 [Actinoplanes missouriensis 431]|uniref:Uncharacterized protein n=1 Tax=Actinoplanes missouriensis (strain ATCC 14538 / DSM 43046 / CBS 188.64 / JCM 3121 / NBRC 102363 / NCIMB 12654 / NRRL B-3342 / UNCC 431) TaxID=512565 RepID=I0GXJ1_ACTM4|nr:hypothetical protein [Actinoplanes missouriensis]BAL85478.1 hypothetical protein AMIS_2580 [Actinoplanes missouriensis 431]
MREREMYELIEVDPATGNEDQLITTGTLRQVTRAMRDLIADMQEDWECGGAWSWLRIQPAA